MACLRSKPLIGSSSTSVGIMQAIAQSTGDVSGHRRADRADVAQSLKIEAFQQGIRSLTLLITAIAAQPMAPKKADCSSSLPSSQRRCVAPARCSRFPASSAIARIHGFTAEQAQVRARLHHGIKAAIDQLHQGAFANTVATENGR